MRPNHGSAGRGSAPLIRPVLCIARGFNKSAVVAVRDASKIADRACAADSR